jgi:hypothetical protein
VCDSPSNMPKCNTLHAQFYTNSYTYYERSQLFISIYVLFSVPGGFMMNGIAPRDPGSAPRRVPRFGLRGRCFRFSSFYSPGPTQILSTN